MSFFHDSIPTVAEEYLEKIWGTAKALEVYTVRIEIDTFLGAVSIIDEEWAEKLCPKYIGAQTVVEDLREKWDAMRQSDIPDLEFDKIVNVQATQLLAQLKAKASRNLDVASFRIDDVEIGN